MNFLLYAIWLSNNTAKLHTVKREHDSENRFRFANRIFEEKKT